MTKVAKRASVCIVDLDGFLDQKSCSVQQGTINRDRAFIVQIGFGDRGAMDFSLHQGNFLPTLQFTRRLFFFTQARPDVTPSRFNKLASRSRCGFLVVNSTSPMNIEFAPAKKQNACSSSVMYCRPADNRTTLFGIMIRAVATRTVAIGLGGSAVSFTGTP
ncbi:hypothetical protein ACVWXO_001049 [Bradyrhizobium sp. LM2.7]